MNLDNGPGTLLRNVKQQLYRPTSR